MTPHGIQLVTRPGRMSGAQHAAHLLGCIFTAGLWLPIYLIAYARSPYQRVEVIAPYGTDPALVDRARREAEQRAKIPPSVIAAGLHNQPPQGPLTRRQILVRCAIVGGIVAFLVLMAALSPLTD